MISHTSLFQSADDLFTLYRGRCSDDQKSGGIEEAKEIISEIRKMEEYGLAVGENIYNIKFTNVFDLKAAWGVLGRGGGNANFFCSHCFIQKHEKCYLQYIEKEELRQVDIANATEELWGNPSLMPK